jgi:hypothetical protein
MTSVCWARVRLGGGELLGALSRMAQPGVHTIVRGEGRPVIGLQTAIGLPRGV